TRRRSGPAVRSNPRVASTRAGLRRVTDSLYLSSGVPGRTRKEFLMTFRLRPYPLSGVALAFVLALVIAAQSWGDRPQETPGVPPGTALPGTAQAPADAGPPSWRDKAFLQGVVAVSHPLAAEAGARMLENGGNAIDAAAAVQFV